MWVGVAVIWILVGFNSWYEAQLNQIETQSYCDSRPQDCEGQGAYYDHGAPEFQY